MATRRLWSSGRTATTPGTASGFGRRETPATASISASGIAASPTPTTTFSGETTSESLRSWTTSRPGSGRSPFSSKTPSAPAPPRACSSAPPTIFATTTFASTTLSSRRAAREKIHMASYISNLSPKFEVGKGFTPNVHGEIPKMKIGHKLSFSHHLKQGTRCTNWSLSDSMLSKWIIGYPCERIGQDTDFGGVDDYYLIVVENLEKDLTPLAMMEFISKEAKVLSQAFILPSLSSDYVTRGNILLDSRRNFERLCDFLENPDQVVVSSNGRPWVITEKMSVRDALLVSIETFALISQKILGKTKNIGSGSGLKVVRRGTVEYTIAKKLSNLYKEFSNHQKKLQKRLIVDEGKIWQEYNAERRVRS
ncbi:uncharacterized protein LOC21388354 isoform X3 [Morus notabilis]|uniref:uncharacterized protein LOC21388354 isoform X3 n=1 Tax=Morus notabilis TaxID=981085 RepID=UPI000CED3BCA|nr:uncharacterized protein LOC21388354 isoform X3 [Morus notabilis]